MGYGVTECALGAAIGGVLILGWRGSQVFRQGKKRLYLITRHTAKNCSR